MIARFFSNLWRGAAIGAVFACLFCFRWNHEMVRLYDAPEVSLLACICVCASVGGVIGIWLPDREQPK